MPQKETIEKLFKDDSPIGIRTSLKESNIAVREREARQKRITLYHYIVHLLAILIIVPYLVLVIFQIKVPPEYSTIVSVVVGFYFARSLFDFM